MHEKPGDLADYIHSTGSAACMCCILGYITHTTSKTSPSEKRHQLLGMFLGIMYIAHYAGY